MTKEPQLHQPAANSRGGFVTVLISFATTEGQTLKIAERISLQIRERGHEVNLYDTASMTDVPEVAAFDAMIVAASVHEEHHQDSAVNFAAAHLDQLICKPSGLACQRRCQTGRPKLNIMSIDLLQPLVGRLRRLYYWAALFAGLNVTIFSGKS